MMRCALVVVSLLLLPIAPRSEVLAQQLVELAPGARVRIQALPVCRAEWAWRCA